MFPTSDCAIQEVSIIAMATEQSPHTHTATLLINDKYIAVVELGKTVGPNMVSCFALDNSMPTLPIVVPVLSLVQVKRCHSLIFCLFSSGTASILWQFVFIWVIIKRATETWLAQLVVYYLHCCAGGHGIYSLLIQLIGDRIDRVD